MGNSQQKEQIEKFHQEKLQQIQSSVQQERFNGPVNFTKGIENSRVIRSHSTPQNSQFKPSINHIAVIRNSNRNVIIQSSTNIRPRSTSFFKPVLKQIIIQPPPQQTPAIKLIIPAIASTNNSSKFIQPQSLIQSIPLGNMNLNQQNQSFVSRNQVSPLSFVNKKAQDELKQSVTPFELTKSDQKNDENTSPFKRDSHWRVDQLLQAIQPNQQQQNNNSALLDLNFNSLKPMSGQLQAKQSKLRLQKVPIKQNEQENNNSANKSGVRFQDVDIDEDKMYTPPRVQSQKQDNSIGKGADINSQSLSIKEQFEFFDSVLQKQLNYSQCRNQRVQINSMLQEQSDQKGQLKPVEESNENEYKYTQNGPNNFNNNQQHQTTNSNNIADKSQVGRQSNQQFSSNSIKLNETAQLDGLQSGKEKTPQSCYQSEIKPQEQIEESSFIQQINFLNQKIELTDQIREQKAIQQELSELEAHQRVTNNQSQSPNRQQKQIQQNMQQPQEDNKNSTGMKSILSQQSQQGLAAINTQILQPKNQLKVITNQQEYCEQMQKNLSNNVPQQLFQENGQLKTIAQLSTGQTYYYFQPQGAILYQQQQNSPIKHLQKDLIHTHSLEAGLISPNNNQITYYRNQSPLSNQLELPVSFTNREHLIGSQLNNRQYDQNSYKQDNKIIKSPKIQQKDLPNNNSSSKKNNQQDQSYYTDQDNVRMASVKVANNNMNTLRASEIYSNQPQQQNTKDIDFIFSQNMQNRILDARLQEDSTAPQTPPNIKMQNTNYANQSRNSSSISSAYTFNQKAYENRQEKHKVKHFTLKIDSVKKEIINSDQYTDSAMAKDSTLNLTDQKQFRKDQNIFDQREDSISQNYSPSSLKRSPSNLVKKIENIQENVRKSLLKSNEMNEILSQTLNATLNHDSKNNKQFSHYCEGQEMVELEPYPDDQSNLASNNNNNNNVNQSEKSPIRKSKIKIYHGKIEHIKISQQYQPENLILYKLDEQLNALIPVVLENNQQKQETNISDQQNNLQIQNNSIFNNNYSPIKSYEDLLKEQQSGSKSKRFNSSNKKMNLDDIVISRNRSSSGDKNQQKLTQNQKQFNDSNSKIKYFQHQLNPKDNAYHQVLMKYSDKMLNEITKSMLVPNSYQYQHLNQKLYKQKQANQLNQSLSSSKKQKFV